MGQIWAPKIIIHDFYLCQLLDVVSSYHCMQFQSKIIIKTQENGEKPHFRPDIGSLGPNLDRQFYFFQKSGLVSHEIGFIGHFPTNVVRPTGKYKMSYRRFKGILCLFR